MGKQKRNKPNQYVVDTLSGLLDRSSNGVLSRPHITQIFSQHKVTVDCKSLVRKKVLIDLGLAVNSQTGSHIAIYTNEKNLARALQWKNASAKKSETVQELLKQGVQVIESGQSDAVITSEQVVPAVHEDAGRDNG